MKILGVEISRARPASAAALRVEPPVEAAKVSASGTSNPDPWLQEVGWGGSRPASRNLPRATPARSEQHGTVFACCNNLAGDFSKVPLKIYERKDDGQEVRVRDHPAAYLLNVEASPGVPAQVLRFSQIYAYALRGNGFAYGPRDGGGELTMLDLPSAQDAVSVRRHGRERFYAFEDGAGVYRQVPSRSMVHLRYMATDGWAGRSPIQVAAESVSLALAGQDAAARTASGGVAKAVIKLDDFYDDDEQRQRNAKRIKSQISDPNADGIPVMGPGEDIKNLDLSAADQELLASRKFDREMIAAIYRMPPSKLQMLEYGVKANGEQQAIDYLTDCLLHWGKQIEAQLQLTILTEEERRRGLFFRHDFGALLQPTIKEQYEALTKAIGGPFMTPDEGRAIIGKGSIDGGNKLNPAPNMTRKEDAKETKDD